MPSIFPSSRTTGWGLARLEFIINNYIRIHPMALIHFDHLADDDDRKKIEQLTVGYEDKKDFFVDRLAQGVAKIAAAFYPKDVIVRMSDFKSNEYANLIGGSEFEPIEDNPMIGFRGASRYYDEDLQQGFALECLAMKKVRDEMGLIQREIDDPFLPNRGGGEVGRCRDEETRPDPGPERSRDLYDVRGPEQCDHGG